MSLYIDFFAGLLLAICIDRAWLSKWRFSRPGAILAAAASLSLLAPTLPWVSSTAHVPALFQRGTTANEYFQSLVPEGTVAVVLPSNSLRPDTGYAVLWQAVDGMAYKMPEGDLLHGGADGVATIDPEPSPLWTAISDLQHGRVPSGIPAVRSQLKDLGVRVVVVGPMDYEELAVAYFSAVFGRPPVDTAGVHIWTAQ
jgi:hypothetical protein